MKLIKKKLLHLNHKVSQFYPEFKGKWKDEVTIKHLLTHSSGLKAYEQYYLDASVNNYNDIIKDITTKQKLSAKPGSKFIYSDLGMILLMDIAQIVTGRKFENLVQSWILNQLT